MNMAAKPNARTATKITAPEAYGALIEPTTLKIQRLLPGPIERVWAYLTESELRRQWLAAGEMEMKVGATFTFTWRNDELSTPPTKRPDSFPKEHTLESRITELDPPRKLAIAWGSSGGVSFELEPQGRRGAAHPDPSPPARPPDPADGQRRLAHASRRPRRARGRQGAAALLGGLEPPQGGIRPAAAGLTRRKEMTAKFQGGKNIAMKVPPHQHEATVRFYRDLLGLEQIDGPAGDAVRFQVRRK